MYRRLRFVFLSVLFVLAVSAFFPQGAAAQVNAADLASEGAGGKAGHTVSGTVVNSVTGEPVSRALVQLGTDQAVAVHPPVTEQQANALLSLYRERAMLTDHEGRFKFDGLPSMNTSITARKPGFFSPNELNGGLARPNRVEVGGEGAQVIIKLVPEAIISGRVTDANGEALEGATIRIVGLQHTNGRRQLQPVLQDQEEPQTWSTNEDGEYRAAGLMPGNYYIVAVPNAGDREQAQPMGLRRVAYPVTYYPGVAELADASPVQIAAGQRAEIDFTIRPAPVILVSGSVTGLAHGQEMDLQFSNQSGDDLALDKRFDAQTATFQAHIIAAGPCLIKADSKDTGDRTLHAQLTLNATSNVRNLRLNLAPALSIPIVVRRETTRPPPVQGRVVTIGAGVSVPVSVNLHPVEMGRPDVSASIEGGPTNPLLVLRNVEAGRYKVEAIANNAENNTWYVKSILYGGADLFREELTVVPGQAAPMEIVLRDDSAMLHGTVQSDENEAQAAVLVVPDYAPLDPKMIVANDRGEFQLDGLAPGEYKVFAFDRLDGLEYSNPEALGEYASRAAQVNLLPNETTSVKVDLIQRGE